MKFRYLLVVVAFFAVGACTNKKLENNIKSLEKRVAALEKRSGVASNPSENVVAASNTSTVDAATLPVISFTEKEYDFGRVKEGEVVNYTFQFTNTGKSPLLINKADATCGCTVPEWPKEPIGVGQTGEIKIKFNSKNRTNQQTKYVNITANTKPEVTRLKITGFVEPENDQSAN